MLSLSNKEVAKLRAANETLRRKLDAARASPAPNGKTDKHATEVIRLQAANEALQKELEALKASSKER
jgi:outer membrane murein-binding lipoprotein Lpp